MPTINIFDRTLKVVAQSCAETFLRLAFPGQHVELVGEEANVTINLPEERVDGSCAKRTRASAGRCWRRPKPISLRPARI